MGDIAAAVEKKNQGNEFYKTGDYSKAIELYTEAIALDPQNASYYGNRAAAKTMKKDYRSAIDDCRSALRVDPTFGKGYLRAGKCFMALGDYSEAARQLAEAAKAEPDNKAVAQELESLKKAEQLLRFAQEALSSKDYRRAIHNSEQGLVISPSSSDFYLIIVMSYIGQKNFGEATRVANDLLRADTNNVDAIYLKGLVHYEEGENDKAKQHFLEALRVHPDHEKSKINLKKVRELEKKKTEGNDAFTAGDYQKAYDLYTEALLIDPENKATNSKLYSNRATVGSKLGNYEQAIKDCDAALEIDPEFLKVYLRRADLYMKTENYEKAVQDYEKCRELDQSNREILQALKDAKFQLKKSQRKDYYKILAVEKEASEEDIKKAYKRMALKFHPDKTAGGNEAELAEAEAKFKEIGEAYSVLSDPQKKRRYDTGADLEEGMGGMGGGMDAEALFRMFFAQQGGMGGMGGFGGYGRGGHGHGFGGGHGHSHGGYYYDDEDEDDY